MSPEPLNFTLQAMNAGARAGVLYTSHGQVPTPAFMPVATQATVKAIDSNDLELMGTSMLLGNAYHLYLRPGIDIIERLGGLHSIMSWRRPILTDSGGFQGFSLAHLRHITEDGILFKSHIDGSQHNLTPEAAIVYQERLGADVIMPLDVCIPSHSDRGAAESAMERTTRWAVRSLEAHSGSRQQLFGIVQGGLVPDLRERSVAFTTALGFPGYAIGGLSVGESKYDMHEMAGFTAKLMPDEAPRYLMGVGAPDDLVECVARGIDMFDCVLPTRIARNGTLFVPQGRLNIGSARFKVQDGPVDDNCDCYVCRTFSVAYLHHLFKAKELLAQRLATIHNVRFVLRLMEEIRVAIIEGNFAEYREAFKNRYLPTDEKIRLEQRQKWVDAKEKNRSIGNRLSGNL